MALETLADLQKINRVEVHRVKWTQPPDHFIEICDEANAITFKLQNGPIKAVGKNGCQVDDIITVARDIIRGLNRNFPCRENAFAALNLEEALLWLEARKYDRENRGVEGTNQA